MSFLVWGLLNGLYQVAGSLSEKPRRALRGAVLPREDSKITALWQMAWVFGLSTIAWVFFEAGTVSGALAVLRNMVKPVLWDAGGLAAMGMDRLEFLAAGAGLVLLTAVDALSQRMDVAQRVLEAPRWVRWCVYLGLLMIVVIFGSYGTGYNAQDFIYGRF